MLCPSLSFSIMTHSLFGSYQKTFGSRVSTVFHNLPESMTGFFSYFVHVRPLSRL